MIYVSINGKIKNQMDKRTLTNIERLLILRLYYKNDLLAKCQFSEDNRDAFRNLYTEFEIDKAILT